VVEGLESLDVTIEWEPDVITTRTIKDVLRLRVRDGNDGKAVRTIWIAQNLGYVKVLEADKNREYELSDCLVTGNEEKEFLQNEIVNIDVDSNGLHY
jgi:hypothetical protein